MSKSGRLYWITGLSGAGKTTISTLLYDYLKKKQDNIFLIDGDKIREVYQNTDYTEEGRKKIAYMNMHNRNERCISGMESEKYRALL